MKRKRENPIQSSASSRQLEDPVYSDLDANGDVLKKAYADCSDVAFRSFVLQNGKRCLLIFIDNLIDSTRVEESIITPLTTKEQDLPQSTEELKKHGVASTEAVEVKTLAEANEAILNGNAVLFLDGDAQGLRFEVSGGERRAVAEPETETVIRGPREGFNEKIGTSLGMVRVRVRTHQLKTVSYKIGRYTKTNVVLAYIEGLASPNVIKEVKRRLESIKMDAVLESGYIEEIIEDAPRSPFPQFQYTERPDTLSAMLLEGRFAIFVDGTPFVLVAPITFWQLFQSSEDYYERFMISTLIRWLRYLFLFIALFTPSLYIAVITFHQDMLPTNLLLSIAAARESIPFPALVEALIMEVTFEALREAGIRLPKTVGQAVSILGALVIGQSAVQAGIVSAPVVMVVAITGIASFTIPRFNAAISIRMLRFPLMFLAAMFGLYGLVIGLMLILAHMVNLRSFGVPYLSGIAPMRMSAFKDIFVRVPWWKMDQRPRDISEQNMQCMENDQEPKPPKT